MLNSLKKTEFIKQFVAACAFEQKDINWVKTYWDFYPYDISYKIKIEGNELEAEVDILTFEEGFNFSIPKGLKEEMANFRWSIKEMMGLFSEGSKIEILLRDVEIDVNVNEIIGVSFSFKFSLHGEGSSVYGHSLPMRLKWEKKEEKKEESNVMAWDSEKVKELEEIDKIVSLFGGKEVNDIIVEIDTFFFK